MDRTMLVVGEVNQKQQDQIYLTIPRDNHPVKVVRIPRDQFLLDTAELTDKYGSRELIEKLSQLASYHADYNRDFDRFADQHLQSFGTLVVVVMDKTTWRDWPSLTEGDYVFLAAALERTYDSLPLWTAHPDGRLEYVGQ